MTLAHKIELWIVLLVGTLIAAGVPLVIRWQKQKTISLQGAVLIQDSDPRKQQPIGGVLISAGDTGISEATTTDSSGYFVLKVRKPIRRGNPIVLTFRHPQYHPLVLNEFVGNKLYIVHLVPLTTKIVPANQPQVKVTNVRIRYTIKAMTELNVGSAVKTFEIENKADVPCQGRTPCSPDGRWKAATGSVTLNAGGGNQFRNTRASCIAGPCPFTRIDSDQSSQGGQVLTLSARDWSDTATFLLEAEVFRPMVSQMEHWSYPVIFGESLSFTLPSAAESVSIEADLDGQTIIFPLGPSLFLSWASCDAGSSVDRGRVYRCTPKPGYAF
ncbi:MAG TPA: hypothetical protein VFL34_14270 [Candidatus Sulfotelmatobacter sp.]|nr:hypothetical protein [Candidatus Sulfotelmatobacter sp.]